MSQGEAPFELALTVHPLPRRQVSFAAVLLQAYQHGDFKALLTKAGQSVPDSIQPFSVSE